MKSVWSPEKLLNCQFLSAAVSKRESELWKWTSKPTWMRSPWSALGEKKGHLRRFAKASSTDEYHVIWMKAPEEQLNGFLGEFVCQIKEQIYESLIQHFCLCAMRSFLIPPAEVWLVNCFITSGLFKTLKLNGQLWYHCSYSLVFTTWTYSLALVSCHELKFWTSGNFSLLVALD